jgi:4-amino-4-deoxy-L-arabinose transferase-like glycosyltransferase
MIDETKRNLTLWLGIVLIVAISTRVLLFLAYPPVSYSDTASYRRSAEAVLGGFEDYDGTRTPGYPTWMALVGSDRTLYASQLALGLGITLSWFYIGYKSSGKPFLGGLAALAHTLNPGQLFFEANLITETLSTFWLTLAFLGAFIWYDKPNRRSFWLGLGIGLAAALATLTRPLFIFLPIWLALCLGFSVDGKKLRLNWQPIAAVLLPAILLVGGWMRWIQTNYHVFSLTTMTGFHLVQHTGYYFEDVPDAHAVLREVYLEYRDARIAETGTQGNTIWDAIPAMQAASGMNFYELSRTLQSISIDLILTHPGEYFSRVLRGWWMFWRAPIYWDRGGIPSDALAAALSVVILGARGLLVVGNLLFIFASLAALVSRRVRDAWEIKPFHILLAGSVWATSVASSLMDHGDNPRFLVPLQTVVVFLVLWVAYQSWQFWLKPGQTKEVAERA